MSVTQWFQSLPLSSALRSSKNLGFLYNKCPFFIKSLLLPKFSIRQLLWGFWTSYFYSMWLLAPWPTTQKSWGDDVFWGGFSPRWQVPIIASEARIFAHTCLALPRGHDKDVHALNLVGINGISPVILRYSRQQTIPPRDHILPPWPPVPISGGTLVRHRIQKLVSRYDRYLNFGGEYVQK